MMDPEQIKEQENAPQLPGGLGEGEIREEIDNLEERPEKTPHPEEIMNQEGPPPMPRGGGPSAGPEMGNVSQLEMAQQDIMAPLKTIIEPKVSPEYRKQFQAFETMISRTLAVANIERDEIPVYLDYFDLVFLWMKAYGKIEKLTADIRWQFRFLMKIQLTRAVEGFERRIEITSREEMARGVSLGQKEEEDGGFWFFG